MTATDTTVFSYSIVIRDMFLAKLKAAPFFAGFTFRKSRTLPAQSSQLPFLGVYFVKEEMDPEGDPNHGEIDFIHNLTIGFSVVVVNNDPEACQEKLDQAYWCIMNTLWRDPYLMNFIDTRAYPGGIGNPDNVRIEGLLKGNRRFHDQPNLDNETPIGEMRYEQIIRYRAEYAPIITDELLQIHQQTVPLATDGTIPPADEVLRVITDYEFYDQEQDTIAPTAPTGLTATPISSAQINLAWIASTDNVGVTGYRVLRDGNLITTVTTNNYANTGLTPNTTYAYQVKAVDAAGNVSAAAMASATTPATTPPSTADIADENAANILDETDALIWDETGP